MAITQTRIGATPTEIYKSDGMNAVVVAYFCNTGTNPVQLSLYIVRESGTANDTSIIYKNINLTAEDTYLLDTEKIILDNNESLHASCTVADVVQATINTIGV